MLRGEQGFRSRQIHGADATTDVFRRHPDGLQIGFMVVKAPHTAQDQICLKLFLVEPRHGGLHHLLLVQSLQQMELGRKTDLGVQQALLRQFRAQVGDRSGDGSLCLEQGAGKIEFFQVLVQIPAGGADLELPQKIRVILLNFNTLHGSQLPDGRKGQGAIQMQMQIDQSIIFHKRTSLKNARMHWHPGVWVYWNTAFIIAGK